MMKIFICLLIISMIAVFSLAGCELEVAEEVTREEAVEVVEEEAEEPEEIIEEEFEIEIESLEEAELPNPIPEEGKGNAAGRVYFNSQPIEGVKVTICEEISMLYGCKGAEYKAVSDEKGVYCIENIPPGEYPIIFQLPGEENYYLYFADIFGITAEKISIVEGETTQIENFHTFKKELKLISPQDKEEIDSRNPILEWEPYDNARYYSIRLFSEYGDIGKLSNKMTEETFFQIEKSLLRCKYTWKIESINQYGRKLAESEYFNFFVKADGPSCYLKLLTPSDKEKIKQGMGITFSWEEHSMADRYNLSVRNTETNEYVVDFVKIDSTSFELTEVIPEGEYYWGVSVEDSFGTNVAYGFAYFEIVK